jgi:hypothetical protein
MDTLDRIIKLIKKLRIKKADANDIMEKLTKGMSKLVLTTTQAVTEKVTIAIRQMPTYIISNFTPSSKQTGR